MNLPTYELVRKDGIVRATTQALTRQEAIIRLRRIIKKGRIPKGWEVKETTITTRFRVGDAVETTRPSGPHPAGRRGTVTGGGPDLVIVDIPGWEEPIRFNKGGAEHYLRILRPEEVLAEIRKAVGVSFAEQPSLVMAVEILHRDNESMAVDIEHLGAQFRLSDAALSDRNAEVASLKGSLAFAAQEVDRLRAEVEHHKGVAAANAHRERWEQRRAGRAEAKLRDLEALVRAERIKQRSGTTSLLGAADFILGVSDPSTQAVSTTSPISESLTAQERP